MKLAKYLRRADDRLVVYADDIVAFSDDDGATWCVWNGKRFEHAALDEEMNAAKYCGAFDYDIDEVRC